MTCLLSISYWWFHCLSIQESLMYLINILKWQFCFDLMFDSFRISSFYFAVSTNPADRPEKAPWEDGHHSRQVCLVGVQDVNELLKKHGSATFCWLKVQLNLEKKQGSQPLDIYGCDSNPSFIWLLSFSLEHLVSFSYIHCFVQVVAE